jgi:uncharacterized membrane protein YfcA
MVFEASGVEVSPLVPIGVAFVISFFTSMGGVSGAFLLLPFQMSVLGFTSPAVSPTNLVFNIVAIPSGVCRYIREHRMAWPLAWVVTAGTLPGVFIGAIIRIVYLPDPKFFKLFVGCVLLYIGIRLVFEFTGKSSIKSSKTRNAEERFARQQTGNSNPGENDLPLSVSVRTVRFSLTNYTYEFYGESFSFNTLALFGLTFAVGIIGGTYGIGGGALVAPFLITFFGLPVYTIAGAALLGTFITSLAGVAFYSLIAPLYAHTGLSVAPDWILGFMFGLGGFMGMYCGARFQKHMPAGAIKLVLAITILFLSVRYIFSPFL